VRRQASRYLRKPGLCSSSRSIKSSFSSRGAKARAKLGLDPAERILLFVGNLRPVKGLDVLMDACMRLMLGGLRFQCLLIGHALCGSGWNVKCPGLV
jgi:glycosyltransferase involved in cell wall biosynthesis